MTLRRVENIKSFNARLRGELRDGDMSQTPDRDGSQRYWEAGGGATTKVRPMYRWTVSRRHAEVFITALAAQTALHPDYRRLPRWLRDVT